jgi:hypothetical protein
MSNGTAPRRRTTNRKSVLPAPDPPRPQGDDIAGRAFEIFLSRGGAHGHDREDWLQAERDVRAPAARRES